MSPSRFLTQGGFTVAISIEERREIARRNGAISRGAKSPETRFICSRNSLKHGCYALVHRLDSEDPLEDLALRDRWFADVGPQNVEEEFYTEQMFRAHRLANRVERARQDQFAKQVETATAPWHDQRDASVAKLRKELAVTNDATDILAQLRQTTLGIETLAEEIGRLGAILDTQGYWGPAALDTMVTLSGCASDPAPRLSEDEDAYRLYLWTYQCRPEPPRDLIERMLDPAHRPPGLRNVERDVLLPAPAECLERLRQWVADMLAELGEEAQRVWTEVEAPELARRTATAGIIRDANVEARIHRGSNEYRAIFYKARNGLDASRKRAEPEAKEARKAKRADSRRSDDRPAHAGRAGKNVVADTPASAAASVSQPLAAACVVEVKADVETPRPEGPEMPSPGQDAQNRNEPTSTTEVLGNIPVADSSKPDGVVPAIPAAATVPSASQPAARACVAEVKADVETPRPEGPEMPSPGQDAQNRDEPTSATETFGNITVADSSKPAGVAPAIHRPSDGLGRAERCRDGADRGLALSPLDLPYWEDLSPMARSVIASLDKKALAEIRGSLKPMRSEQRLRE